MKISTLVQHIISMAWGAGIFYFLLGLYNHFNGSLYQAEPVVALVIIFGIWADAVLANV